MQDSDESDRFVEYSWICERCKSKLDQTFPFGLFCVNCKANIDYSNGTLFFSQVQTENHDLLLRFKNALKKYIKIYDCIVWLLSPVYWSSDRLNEFKKEMLKAKKQGINLGSGNSKREYGILNFEISNYPNVDVVTDGLIVPLESESIDFILSIAVLEHAKNPVLMVEEWNRVLRKGGFVYCTVPFIQGFHAAPYDFQRFTSEGLRVLFKGFEVISIKGHGSTSAMLWVFQEWVVDFFGCGSKRLRMFIWFAITLLTFPIKFLDVFLDRINAQSNISSYFEVRLKKHI
jgi:predicted SAM-dependent methyltransferase